jgi:hypothetical protein
MKRLLSSLAMLLILAGIVWYESRPAAVPVPVDVPQDAIMLEIPTSTTLERTTTTTSPGKPADFSSPELHLEIEGVDGDTMTLEEAIRRPKPIGEMPEYVQEAFASCWDATERDVVIRIDARATLTSNMPADIDVDYGTVGNLAVFEFNDGPVCKSDGDVVHHLQPNQPNTFTYWVLVPNYLTPSSPGGDMSKSWYINGPEVALPGMQAMHWHLWGSNVAKCDGLFGDISRVHIAGVVPASLNGCQPAYMRHQALGTS